MVISEIGLIASVLSSLKQEKKANNANIKRIDLYAFNEVGVAYYNETEDIYDIEGTIYCLRESHKGIIIGKGGNLLKKIEY